MGCHPLHMHEHLYSRKTFEVALGLPLHYFLHQRSQRRASQGSKGLRKATQAETHESHFDHRVRARFGESVCVCVCAMCFFDRGEGLCQNLSVYLSIYLFI